MANTDVRAIRNDLRRYLMKVRAESEALSKKKNTLDPRWSDQSKREAMAGWRAESASRLDALLAPVAELTKSGLAAQDYWSTKEYLRRQPLVKSTGSDTTQNAILEELRRINTREDVRRLSVEEMGRKVDGAIETGAWGELSLLLTEAEDRRRAQPDQFEWALFVTTIEKTAPPEVQEAHSLITEIRNVAQWIQSTRQSIATGAPDHGISMEQSLLASQERNAGDEASAKERMRLVIDAAKKNAA